MMIAPTATCMAPKIGVRYWHSHQGGKKVRQDKKASSPFFANEKPRADWKEGLQTCGESTKSKKRPALVVGKKSNGKYRSTCVIHKAPGDGKCGARR
jgi:hypothetical protein